MSDNLTVIWLLKLNFKLSEELERLQKENSLLRECVEFYANKTNWHEVETDFGLIKACIDRSDENAIPNGIFKTLEITQEQSENYDVIGGKHARQCLAKMEER